MMRHTPDELVVTNRFLGRGSDGLSRLALCTTGLLVAVLVTGITSAGATSSLPQVTSWVRSPARRWPAGVGPGREGGLGAPPRPRR